MKASNSSATVRISAQAVQTYQLIITLSKSADFIMSSGSIPTWRNSTNSSERPNNPRKRPAPSDAQEEAWVAEEDQFVLRQAKKKAALRVKGKRPKPIDWLAVTLSFIDPTKNALDEDEDDADLEVTDPEGLLESLDQQSLQELEKDIDTYLHLEQHPSNREYWQTMKLICKERLAGFSSGGRSARGIGSVSADVEKLLGPKTYEELEALEKQIRKKLDSDEPIDVDYWEHLLKSLKTFKARARLRKVSQAIVDSRLKALRKEQENEASRARMKLRGFVESIRHPTVSEKGTHAFLDPEPLLKLSPEDKTLDSVDERTFLQKVTQERQRIHKLGYVPANKIIRERPTANLPTPSSESRSTTAISALTSNVDDESSEMANAQFQREVARGVQENEEVFTNEENIAVNSSIPAQMQLRKPKFFNRVQLGYEWNKYNQTHYDHDNPPPKVVQGYRFNIFYPNLIDKTKAPTYRIEREGGRKRGQTVAPAGEDDTCIIRFIASPPYQDIAFRIVDKEWDYSAKRDRGFKSTFENGVLSLHFQFKKVYYRK
ncbi:hypothetical protein, variant [Verruconis gallopava]|uniref:Splicing factor Cactin n=1 Tax=Verruconis gallopava TaxID=253628 RepID=A0A0D2BDZ9_9PEZI|nr:uncharacterized protein PV09_00482 [Verruconis gallopava]XP_016219484.1 hypothetical protein, variant [Verruconis gallopava]KIW09614.1 hypothetical protein PV09_00482 [Verruconis gallopava]KIW09615.1 hypothetical protein, variant [Verruconis gallopava]